MARKIFFSFHYERDAWRASQVRNSNVVSSDDRYGFIDKVDWESIKKNGDDAIKHWIDDQLENTSVTAVLIGAETASREWVQYEIARSWNRGNGLVGVRIEGLKDQDQQTDAQGRNPFDDFTLPDGTRLSSVCKDYNWNADEGRKNFGKWAEEAADMRAKYAADDEIVLLRQEKKEASKGRSVSVSAGFAPRSPWSSR